MKRFVKFGVRVSVSFTIFMLFICMLVPLVGEEAKEISELFSMGAEGIAFPVIMQGFFLISLITLISVILEEPRVLKHVLYLWKVIINLVLCVILTIVFIIVFKWFPTDNMAGWIGFIISFGICVSGSMLFMMYKTKKEDEEVQQLFHTYQQQKGKGQDHEND